MSTLDSTIRRFLFAGAMALVFALVLSGCATTKPSEEDLKWLRETSAAESEDATAAASSEAASATDSSRESLVIRPGNFLTLSSLEDSALNGRFRVRLDGTVDLPYAKRLRAAGLSPVEFQTKVRNAYREYFKDRDVGITVRISDREILVDVRGLVQKPGRYSIDKEASIDEVIGKAGGFLPGQTRPGFVAVRTKSETRYFNLNTYFSAGSGGGMPRWTGGETVTVLSDVGPEVSKQTGPTIRVLGEVRNPGEVAFVPGADIYHYLSIVGGPTLFSDQDRVELVRGSNHERRSIQLTMKDFSQYVNIKNGDVVIVHGNQPTSFERKIQVSAGVASVISTIVLIIVTVL